MGRQKLKAFIKVGEDICKQRVNEAARYWMAFMQTNCGNKGTESEASFDSRIVGSEKTCRRR